MYPFNIHIGIFSIGCYELFNLLGIIFFGVCIVLFLDKKAPFSRPQVILTFIVAAIAGISGSKLLHIILNAGDYAGMNPLEAWLRSGHAALGAFIFAFLAIYFLFHYFFKIDFFLGADYAAPYFGLLRTFGRTGCLFHGCCEGHETRIMWAQYFGYGILSHPVQAYNIIMVFSIFIAGILSYKKLRSYPGATSFLTIISYGGGRFFTEFFRVDSPVILGFLKLSNIVMAAIFIFGLSGYIAVCKRHNEKIILKRLATRYFALLILCAIITGSVILTTLSILPKQNYFSNPVIIKIAGLRDTLITYTRVPRQD